MTFHRRVHYPKARRRGEIRRRGRSRYVERIIPITAVSIAEAMAPRESPRLPA